MVLLVLALQRGGSVLLIVGVHLLTFFVTAVVCHSELARRRPGVEGLTTFYFCMSIGGALGGIFNALIAPLIFSSDYEYYLALVGACALRAFVEGEPKTFNRPRPVYPLLLGLVVAAVAWRSLDASPLGLIGRFAVLLPCGGGALQLRRAALSLRLRRRRRDRRAVLVQGSVDVLHTERNFFGINKVKRIEDGRKTHLIHGTTMHGTEFTDPAICAASRWPIMRAPARSASCWPWRAPGRTWR